MQSALSQYVPLPKCGAGGFVQCYKAVRQVRGRYCSFHPGLGGGEVEYALGRPTRPRKNCGPLGAYARQDMAAQFIQDAGCAKDYVVLVGVGRRATAKEFPGLDRAAHAYWTPDMGAPEWRPGVYLLAQFQPRAVVACFKWHPGQAGAPYRIVGGGAE